MLDFQKRKKKYFDLALHDGTKLKIPTPTMTVFDAMKEVTESQDDTDQLASLVSTLLNTNKQGVEITDEQMESFDLEDMKELFVAYVDFVQEVMTDPNSKSPIAR